MIRRIAVVGLLLLVAGCGDDTEPEATWPPSTDPVDRAGLVWADGSTVHLGDGSTIEADGAIEQFVLAGDGAFYVPASDDGTTGPLLVATPDGVEETGAEAEARSLLVSDDGRHLGFVDLTTGEEDSFGTPVAQAVVVDLATGDEVVRSAAGMGDPDSDDDLLDLYEDADGPQVLAITEDTAYVATPDGPWAYDLATGDGEQVADSTTDVQDEPWYPSSDLEPETNPAGTWTWDDRLELAPRLVPTDGGRAVPTDAPLESWGLSRWLDDRTVLGGGPGADGTVLITCTVPTGACEVVPGTEDGVLLPLP